MMTKKKTRWKFESDCARIESMIQETVEAGKKPGWGVCAMNVLNELRQVRSKATPLALHFISVSATEMLEKRHDNARLCLVVAKSLADKLLLEHQMAIFHQAFGTQVTPISLLSDIIMGMLSPKLGKLPEGISDIVLAPGVTAHVAKKTLGPNNPFTSNPRLN